MTEKRWARGWASAGVAAVTLGIGAAALAQEAGEAPPARPVEIVAGACEELGEPVAELTEATYPEGERIGEPEAIVSETSFTAVDLPLDDLLAEPHAVVVRASDVEPEQVLTCGEIGGIFDELGAVVIGLREQSGSGYAGIAFLAPDDAGGQTNVSVFVAPDVDGSDAPNVIEPVADVPATMIVASDGTPVVAPVAEVPRPTPRPTSTPLPTPTPIPTPTSGAIDVVVFEGGIDMPAQLGVGPAVFTITNDGTEPHGFVMANELYVFSLDVPLAPGESGTLSINLPPGIYTVSDPEAPDGTEPIVVEVVGEG